MNVKRVEITAVELDGENSQGFYVDEDGVLRSITVSYGEALAIHRELRTDGAMNDFVIYEVPTTEAK